METKASSMWWHFTKKSHKCTLIFELQSGTFANLPFPSWWQSPEMPKMYILKYKLALFSGSGMKVTLDLCGCISLERPKINILSYKLPRFTGC